MNLTKICLNIESPKKLKEVKHFLELNNQPINVFGFKFYQFNKGYNFLQYFNGGWCLWSQGKRTVLTFEELKEQIMYSQSKANDTEG